MLVCSRVRANEYMTQVSQCPRKLREGVTPPGAEITGGCERSDVAVWDGQASALNFPSHIFPGRGHLDWWSPWTLLLEVLVL